LAQAHKLGIKTAVFNEPIWSLEDSIGVIEAVKGIADEIKVGPLNHDPRAKLIDYSSICPKIKDALIESGIKPLLKRDFKKFLAASKQDQLKIHCYKAKLRTYAITEYGINGWVDPIKLSSVVGMPVCLVCHGLDHLKYRRYERQGGGIEYTQKAAEAST
jgi:hypothetical protein